MGDFFHPAIYIQRCFGISRTLQPGCFCPHAVGKARWKKAAGEVETNVDSLLWDGLRGPQKRLVAFYECNATLELGVSSGHR